MNKATSVKYLEGHLLKLLSLVTAAFLWFYVVNSEPITTERTYEVRVISPSEVAMDKISHNKVKVILKGARAFLKEYKNLPISLTIDLSKEEIKKGETIRHVISKTDLSLPFGIDLVETSPEAIELHFDRKINKSIPIKVELSENLPRDLKLVHYQLSPAKVFIEGPVSAMKKIGQTKTRVLDIGHFSGQEEIDVVLAPLPEFITYKTKSIHKFKYDIRPTSANIKLSDIEVLFISTAQKFKAETTRVSVELLQTTPGPIRNHEVKIYAEVPTKKGRHRVELRAQLPEGVHLLKIKPKVIRIEKY